MEILAEDRTDYFTKWNCKGYNNVKVISLSGGITIVTRAYECERPISHVRLHSSIALPLIQTLDFQTRSLIGRLTMNDKLTKPSYINKNRMFANVGTPTTLIRRKM